MSEARVRNSREWRYTRVHDMPGHKHNHTVVCGFRDSGMERKLVPSCSRSSELYVVRYRGTLVLPFPMTPPRSGWPLHGLVGQRTGSLQEESRLSATGHIDAVCRARVRKSSNTDRGRWPSLARRLGQTFEATCDRACPRQQANESTEKSLSSPRQCEQKNTLQYA